MSSIQWDKTLSNPIRYSMMSALQVADRVSYAVFEESLGISKSLLSKHITTLVDAEYVRVHKIPRGRLFLTELSSTTLGSKRFADFKEQLLTVGDTIVSFQS